MKPITSTQNPIYKELKQLATSSKARRKNEKTLLEGVHLAESYLDSTQVPELYVMSESGRENKEVHEIAKRCDDMQIKGLVVPDAAFRGISSVEHGVGLMFVIKIPAPQEPPKLTTNAVLLEDVQDPGNLGTILRTAAAAGITRIYCSEKTTAAWSPKVLRSAMGAHFALKVYENCDLTLVIENTEIPVLATHLHADKTIYDADLTQATAWLFGNEGQGVSDTLLSLGVQQVIIPQESGVESLNVSAAAAVCLFEHRRQSLLGQ